MTPASPIEEINHLLRQWLRSRLPARGNEWLDGKLRQLAADPSDRNLLLAFGAVPRFTGKEPLHPTEAERAAAEGLREGWNPSAWTLDQAARILLLLTVPSDHPDRYLRTLEGLFGAAEVGELTALYLSLPLLPHPERHRSRAAEGFRTNMNVVFNAIALDNPYPAEYLDEAAWNQMVLKAIFIGSPLHRIYGLDKRANLALAGTLLDFAHERWAAKRPVPFELWRCVGPFMDRTTLPDVERVFATGTDTEQQAIALACAKSRNEEIYELLKAKRPDLAERISNGNLTWDTLSHP
jgi:hypothetical protein